MAKATRKTSARSKSAQKNGKARRTRAASSAQLRRLGAGASQLTRNAGVAGRKLQRDLGSAVEDNPLIVGAALFAAGAALGYALRGVVWDGAWFDEQRHAVMDRARELARTASDRVSGLRQNRGGDPNEAHS